jgi:hypothetical protein
MSRRALGISLGYSDGSFLFHVINKRNGISTKLAKKITTLYPEISYQWLLKGEGKMIVKKEDEATADLSKKIEFLELHIKGLDARIELLEQKLATLSNTQKKK